MSTETDRELLERLDWLVSKVEIGRNGPKWVMGPEAELTDALQAGYSRLRALAQKGIEADETRFSPCGDNHHNANKCPYCRESAIAAARQKEQG